MQVHEQVSMQACKAQKHVSKRARKARKHVSMGAHEHTSTSSTTLSDFNRLFSRLGNTELRLAGF